MGAFKIKPDKNTDENGVKGKGVKETPNGY